MDDEFGDDTDPIGNSIDKRTKSGDVTGKVDGAKPVD